MEQESRTPDESQIIQQLWRRAYLDTVDDHIRILKEYAESYSRERVEAMEKEKKELKLEIDGCYYAYEDFKLTIASLESKLSTLEETLKAAEIVMDLMKVPTDEEESEKFYDALEKYNAIKN